MLSMWPEELFDEILSDLCLQPESAPLHSPDLLGLFEKRIFWQICGVGDFFFAYRNDGVSGRGIA